MALEEFFNRSNILDLSFFNFRNAISACYFADRDLRIQRTNDNFGKFFPKLGNVANAPFLGVITPPRPILTLEPAYRERVELALRPLLQLAG